MVPPLKSIKLFRKDLVERRQSRAVQLRIQRDRSSRSVSHGANINNLPGFDRVLDSDSKY